MIFFLNQAHPKYEKRKSYISLVLKSVSPTISEGLKGGHSYPPKFIPFSYLVSFLFDLGGIPIGREKERASGPLLSVCSH